MDGELGTLTGTVHDGKGKPLGHIPLDRRFDAFPVAVRRFDGVGGRTSRYGQPHPGNETTTGHPPAELHVGAGTTELLQPGGERLRGRGGRFRGEDVDRRALSATPVG